MSPNAAASTATLVDLETPGAQTEYWLGYRNFYVITRYNRSSFYAMSVFELAEALRLNFVQKVVPAGHEKDIAIDIARQIAAQAPLAVVATRHNVITAIEQGAPAAAAAFIATQQQLAGSADAAEGVRAFVEKRSAHFIGR